MSTPRRCPLPAPPAPRSLLLALLLALIIPLAGCREEEPPPVEPPPQKTAEEIAKEQAQIHLERVRERFARAQRNVDEAPDDFQSHIDIFEGLLFEATGTILEEPVARALAAQKQSREDRAAARLAELAPEVDRLVGQKYYDDAENLLAADFDPAGIFAGTAAETARDEKVRWVRLSSEAEREHERITTRARVYKNQGGKEDLAKAIALLESYPDDFEGTAHYTEVRAMIDEYLQVYLAEKAKIAATEDVPWQDFEVDEYLSSFRSSGEEVWKGVDGVVTGNNTGSTGVTFEIGEDIWTSYVVELELKVPAGKKVFVGATCSLPRLGSGQRTYPLFPLELDTADWVKVLIEYKEGRVQIKNLETLDALVEPYTPRSSQGGVGIGLEPGAQVEVRNIRAKVISKLEPEPPAGGGETPPKGGTDDGG